MDNTLGAQQMPVASASALEKATFIKKTYLHLAFALLGFIGVEYLFLSTPAIVDFGLSMTQGMKWLIMLGGFMFITTLADKWAATSTNRGLQYVALGVYVIAEAFIFVPLLYMAIAMTGDFSILANAGIMSLFLFTALTAIVFVTGKDFSFLKNFLVIGGMLALGLIVLGVLFGFNLGVFFSFAMVALAGASILYQTYNMLNVYHKDQYVAASLGLFASLMLLFWYIISILMRFSGD